jgi:uncharacterized protein YkwD
MWFPVTGYWFLVPGCSVLNKVVSMKRAVNLMKKLLSICLLMLLLASSCFGQDKIEKVLELLNIARTNPQSFLTEYLNPYIEKHELTKTRFVISLVNDLKTRDKVGTLQLSPALTATAEAHAIDMGTKNKVGHISSNGVTFDKRLREWAKAKGAVAENCDYGNVEPIDIVMSLLIDDGIENLGHRKNILEPRLHYIGIAVEKHKKYGFNCVMDFAEKF